METSFEYMLDKNILIEERQRSFSEQLSPDKKLLKVFADVSPLGKHY
jgi:hypothetical protein